MLIQEEPAGSAPAASEVDPVTGLANVDTSLFTPEDDGQVGTEGHEPDGQDPSPTAEETTPAAESQPEDGSEPKGEEQPAEDEQPEPTRLFAGKFESKEDLEAAFINLGGDPALYDTVEKLEGAYFGAESAFTRARQAKAAEPKEEPQPEAPVETPDRDKLIDEAIGKIDWTKVADAPAAMREAARIAVDVMLKTLPTPKIDVQGEISKINKDAEARATITRLEKEVPRLKTDITFRDDFAAFIAGQKQQGRFNGDIEAALKRFMSLGRVTPTQQTPGKPKDIIPEGGAGNGAVTEPVKKDEADEILDAYADRQKKFG